jgi:hypothetical protein
MEEFVWQKTGQAGQEPIQRSLPSDNPALKKEQPKGLAAEEPFTKMLTDFQDLKKEQERNTKREDANTKIGERYLVGQPGQNPFMVDNNYLNDLEIQESFLRPKNSNMDEKE